LKSFLLRGKKEKTVQKNKKREEEGIDTILGPGANFEGDLEANSGVRIDGRFKGNMKLKGLLIIGKTGSVEGEIHARNAVIGGSLEGKIKIDERIEFQTGARFSGELSCKGIKIEDGVKFDGSCSMTKEPPRVSQLEEKRKDEAGR